MARFVVVEVYGSGKGGPYYVRDADGQYADSPKDFRLKRTAEQFAARMQKKADARSRNPRSLVFRTKAAALKYARSHGVKKFSIRKLKRGRA